jgi:Icc-related predicted phosphoesterase
MIIDCISDLHGEQPELAGGDLLIIAGDLTTNDKISQWNRFFMWLNGLEYRKKIFIAGNHDNFLMHAVSLENPRHAWLTGLVMEDDPSYDGTMTYLCDSGTTFEGLKIWGSPWTKNFYGQNPLAMAFGLNTEPDLEEKFKLIPADTDILITHAPPFGILDGTRRNPRRFGSSALRGQYPRIAPKLHVFGHIHEGHGQFVNGTRYVNAAQLNSDYEAINQPIRVVL